MRVSRIFLVVLIAGVLLFPSSESLAAPDFPARPVNLVIGFAAGGGTDLLVRAMNDKFSEQLGGPTVVVNKPGSGGLVAGEFVAKSKPDGYNLLVIATPHLLRQIIDPKMPFDVFRDLSPVCLYVTHQMVLAVAKGSKFKTIEDLIDYAKKNPGKLSMGSPGVGSIGHFAGELFKSSTKVSFKHVPFTGDAPNITALLGGHIDFLISNTAAVSSKVASGDVRLLASFGETRYPDIKDVPTLKERGYPDALISGFFAFAAPAGTPKEIIEKLNKAFQVAIQDPHTLAILKTLNCYETYKGPDDFGKFLRSEFNKYSKVAKEAGISLK